MYLIKQNTNLFNCNESNVHSENVCYKKRLWNTLSLIIKTENCGKFHSQYYNDYPNLWLKEIVLKSIDQHLIVHNEGTEDLWSSSSSYSDSTKFNHPYVLSRLEKLMGSNLVRLTDREYMQSLQENILVDYAECMAKRIKTRETEEMQRVKKLVLSGKIPLDEAPEIMADHPLLLIEAYCRKLIAARRAKIKIPKAHIPEMLYCGDDTPDPPSGLSIENGHHFRLTADRLCPGFIHTAVQIEKSPEKRPQLHFRVEVADKDDESKEKEEEDDDEEDYRDTYMYSKEEFNRCKYESDLIKELQKCDNVEEMYDLADQIVGILSTLDDVKDEELLSIDQIEKTEELRPDSNQNATETVSQNEEDN